MLLTLVACTAPTDSESRATTTRPTSTSTPTPKVSSAMPEPEITESEATTVRFISGNTSVDVAIPPNNPTARDFLSMLPLTLSVEEFAGREKIGTLPRKLKTAGFPGSEPENGDLIYFIPWGNVGFYYNTDGIGYSDQTVHLGTYKATPDQLARLEGSNVTIEVVK
jgi:hypothetical protein